MAILCIDTAADSPVVALMPDAADPSRDRGAVGAGRAQELLDLATTLLDGEPPASITHVVVSTGPGGFTGLRVGIATARGIAETLDVPLHGVSSMLAICAPELAALPVGEVVWAVLDARRGECFVQPWQRDADGRPQPASELQVVPADEVDAIIGTARRTTRPHATPESLALAARHVLQSAEASETAAGDPLTVLPRYGRAPDATPPRMDVRHDLLVEADLPALVRLEQRCFSTPWTQEMYAGELRRPPTDAVHLAARDAGAGNQLIGAALAARIGDSWHVMNVLVDPRARGRGIGRTLMERLLERSEALGAGEGWTLEVRDGNDSAIRLYEGLGFETVGTRRGYYQDTGEDALVMWRYARVVEEATP